MTTVVLDYRAPLREGLRVRWHRYWVSPVSRTVSIAFVVTSIAVLWSAAWLPGAAWIGPAAWAATGALTAYAVARRFVRAVLDGWDGQPFESPPPLRRAARFGRIAVALALTSPLFAWPLRLNLLVHRPVLDPFARQCYAVRATRNSPQTPRLIGLLLVTEIYTDLAGVTLIVHGGGRLRYAALAGDVRERNMTYGGPGPLRWLVVPSSGPWTAFGRRR